MRNDVAEKNDTGKCVIVSEFADSTNGGCVGDSVAIPLRLLERGSKLRVGVPVVDLKAVERAFRLGVGASGDPQLLRHFGIEPGLYGMVVVKANTSFRPPYSKISPMIYCADTPGAGAANLTRFNWENSPSGIYHFAKDIAPEFARIW